MRYGATEMRARKLLGLLSLLIPISGCMAVKGTVNVAQADQAVVRAQERGAGHYAIYEYTLASRYLEKSREELGNNEFRTATELARSAAGFADKAVISMSERGVGGIDFDESMLPEDGRDHAGLGPKRTLPTRPRPGVGEGGQPDLPPPNRDDLEDEDEIPLPPDDPWAGQNLDD